MSTIVQFRAGRVEYPEGGTQATPVRGQGIVKIQKNPEDPNLFSFSWEPRANNKSGEREELLLFPGDASWTHVTECKTGRVFALSFKSSGQNLLFWMQDAVGDEKDVAELTAEDKKIAATVNGLLDENALVDDSAETAPSQPQAQAPGASLAPTEADSAPVARSATGLASNGQEPSAGPSISDSISQVMSNLANSGASTGASGGLEIPVGSISDVVSTQKLVSHIRQLSDDQLQPLLSHIPEGVPKNRHELIRVVQSAQFSQSVEQLGSVLNNHGIGYLVASQLENPYQGEGVEGFLRAARKQNQAKGEGSGDGAGEGDGGAAEPMEE